ncbi:MAG: hypothetical protein K0Q73_9279 [Paenibacillus sp.]|nr:hypothetical protein [Paenibacillus sp.]
MDYTKESISEQIRERIEDKLHLLIDKLAVDLAKDFMFSPNYIVTHEYDPSLDCSGTLVTLNERFSLKDYTCVGDFLQEYTGQSTASYMSGCGIFHAKYEEKYESLISEFIFDCYGEVLSEIDDKHLLELLLTYGYGVTEGDKSDIIQAVTDVEMFEEPFWYHFDILEQIKPISFEMMFLRGKDKAIKQYDNQMQLIKERQDRMNHEKEVAEKLWHRLQKMYKLQTGKIILKIEMKDYEMFKQFLNLNQVSKEERMMLAVHLSNNFSNKVCEYLNQQQ